jgi:adenosine deaminase
MNLLSRDWWHNLTFQQVQQILIEKGNYWEISIPNQNQNLFELNVCLFGVVSNVTLSVGKDQVQQLSADFEIVCGSDRTGKTTGVIKIDLTFEFNFETLVALSRSNNPYLWIRGVPINYPEITILVHEWGKKYEDLKMS